MAVITRLALWTELEHYNRDRHERKPISAMFQGRQIPKAGRTEAQQMTQNWISQGFDLVGFAVISGLFIRGYGWGFGGQVLGDWEWWVLMAILILSSRINDPS